MSQLTPLKAMRTKCLDCTCGRCKEVSNCLIPDCPIYPYRFGKRPATISKQNKNTGDNYNETNN